MKRSTRTLLGMMGLLVFLSAYVVGAATLGGMIVEQHWAVQLAFYTVAGLAWALPLKPLLAWMGRPDAPAGQDVR